MNSCRSTATPRTAWSPSSYKDWRKEFIYFERDKTEAAHSDLPAHRHSHIKLIASKPEFLTASEDHRTAGAASRRQRRPASRLCSISPDFGNVNGRLGADFVILLRRSWLPEGNQEGEIDVSSENLPNRSAGSTGECTTS